MLPNFLVIGALKAGTTSLYEYLRGHPQIFMSRPKEPAFFGSNWLRGLAWYERLFDDAGEAIAIGEASTEYSAHPHVPEVPSRIRGLLPGVRLIYLVRHPVERMLSEYHHNLITGLEHDSSADEALLRDPTYENVSRYALQVEQYLEFFPLDRILILRSEHLRHERVSSLRRVFEHLGVDSRWEGPEIREEFNQSSTRRGRRPVDDVVRKIPGYRALATVAPAPLKRLKHRVVTTKAPPKPALSESARSELEDRLRDDVRRLRIYIGEPFDGWGIG